MEDKALGGNSIGFLKEKILQGNVVKDITGPTSDTPGELGQLWVDTLTNTFYILKEIIEDSGEADSYIWEIFPSVADIETLSDTLNYRISEGLSAPSITTEGEKGSLYIDRTTGKLYKCTDAEEDSGTGVVTYTWEEMGAGGAGGVTALTSADYNWNYETRTTTNPNCVAVWLLDPGIYTIAEQPLKISNHGSNISVAVGEDFGEMFMISMGAPGVSGVNLAKCYTKLCDRALFPQNISGGIQYLTTWEYMAFFDDNGVKIADRAILFDNSLNDLSGNDLTGPLSAVKGKEIKDLVDGLATSGAGAPTTSTVGTVGKLYEDTTNGKLYICTAIIPGTDPDPDTYTWTEVGAGPTVVQTTGTSTTDVMSQNAVTSIVEAQKLKLGGSAVASGNRTTALGYYANATPNDSIAIGANAYVASGAVGAIALGEGAIASTGGELNIGTFHSNGYSSSAYRLIRGVYDGQALHDAATLAQGNTLATSAPTTSTEGVLGQLYTDTTNMHTYQLTAIDTTDPSNPVYNWVQRW